MNEYWKAKVVDNFDNMRKELYIFQQRDNAKLFLTPKGVISVVNGKQPKEPVYFAGFENEQAQAIANAFGEAGIKLASTHKIEGTLEATQKHLEDMRKLVFAPKLDLQVKENK